MNRIAGLLCLISSLISLNLDAQHVYNYNNNWIFGDSIHLQFQNVPSEVTTPTVGNRNNDMRNEEGSASISDGQGNLLFYAARPYNAGLSTFSLYDANDNPMPNGQNLISDESASQGIVMAHDPDNCGQYYVFYTSNVIGNGLRYSKVDMTLNGGLGDVIAGQKDILLYTTRSEKVTLVQKTNSKYFWIVTRRVDPLVGYVDDLVAIELQPGGVFAAPVISTFPAPAVGASIGYMSFRRDNAKMADAAFGVGRAALYDFDASTGIFSNKTIIYDNFANKPYGICYSPSGVVLYLAINDALSGNEIIRRFDLIASPTGAIFSDVSIGPSDGIHAIQRGPNGLLYITAGSTEFLHTITDPDNYAIPGITINSVALTRLCNSGLPNQYFAYENFYHPDLMINGQSQQICYNTSAIVGGTADSLNAVYSWTGQIIDGSGNWTTPSASYLVNPNVTNPTTIALTSPTTRFLLTLLTDCGDTIFADKEFVYLDSLSVPTVTGDLDYYVGETITPLTSTAPIAGVINWYSDATLNTLVGTGTTFTPANIGGATTYYVVEQVSGGAVPQECTGVVTPVTVTIVPQTELCYTKQASQWAMAQNIGLNFLSSSPPSIRDDIQTNVLDLEGTTSLSDSQGNLLFYSGLGTIKNRNHVVMPNGSGLIHDLSAAQGFLSIPNPADTNKYYIFHTTSGNGGVYYSEIDMTLNLGLGDVISGTKNTVAQSNCGEHLTAVEHCNGTDTWVLMHDINNMYAYRISASGISSPVISPVPGLFMSAGQMMFSPTGTHVALSRDNGGCELYTFDNNSGIVCHLESLPHGGYGCSFSNNGRYLYVSAFLLGIFQYDIQAASISASAIQLHDPFSTDIYYYGQMHLGPDCKLYLFGDLESTNTMGSVINEPNLPGLSCNFSPISFPISNNGFITQYGVPNYIQSWFKDPSYVEPTIDADFTFSGTCASLPVTFTNTSTTLTECPRFTWDFGDPASGANNTSTLENPTHLFSNPGTFTVSVTVEERCQINTQTYDITVAVTNASISGDTTVCINNDVVLTASAGVSASYSWTGPSWQAGGATSNSATLINPGDLISGDANGGWYYLTVTEDGCISTDSVNITILALPEMNIEQTIGVCSITLTATPFSSNGPIESYSWFTGGGGVTIGTDSTVNVAPAVNSQYGVIYTDNEGCSAGTLTQVGAVLVPAAPIVYTPDASYCLGDNVATINTSTGDLWYTDAGLTNQIYNGQNYIPVQSPGSTTYYVIDTTGGCNSLPASVNVTFTNCAPDLCSTNLLQNGDFETYLSCPSGTQQISTATNWSGTASYYNTICNGYYNSPAYWPYFNATNYTMGLNGGGTFPPPSGAGYASIGILGGSGFFVHDNLVQQVELSCSNEYTLQFRAMIPFSDTPPNNTLCVYGSNTPPPYTVCDADLNNLVCVSSPTIFTNNWETFTLTFTPATDFQYLVISGQCPFGGGSGAVFLDDMVLCGTCINPPTNVTASQTAPETCSGNDGAGTVSAISCSTPLTYTWALSANPDVPLSVVQSPTDLVAGAYIVTIADGANCSTTGTVTISTTSPVPAPIVSVTTAPSCVLPTGTITVSSPLGANYEYSINGGATWQSSPVFSGLAAESSVTLIAQDIGLACISPASTIDIPLGPDLLVEPTIITTDATCLSAGLASISNYEGSQTYTFTPAGPSINGAGLILEMTPGFSYSVTTSNGVCTSAASVLFSVADQLSTPNVPSVTASAPSCTAAGVATIVNYDSSITYIFSPVGPSISDVGIIEGLTYGANYTVTASNGVCASLSSTAFSISEQLIIPNTPTLAVTGATCTAPGTATISNYAANTTYSISPPGPIIGFGGQISGTVPNLSYTVSAANGPCTSEPSNAFNIENQLEVPTVMVSADTSFYQGESVLLTASGANTYVWSPSLGLNSINGSSVEASPDETTTYCVTGYNGNFCSDTACVVLTRLFDCNDVFIPTIFSPNGKGPEANETLCLFSNCVDQLKFVIHNRWGQKVFETEDINSCWDGTFNGQAVQSGVYAFNVYLRQLDGAVINKTGTISLVK